MHWLKNKIICGLCRIVMLQIGIFSEMNFSDLNFHCRPFSCSFKMSSCHLMLILNFDTCRCAKSLFVGFKTFGKTRIY